LLGKTLYRNSRHGLVRGVIVETEAYLAENDTACHATRGKTPKNTTMFGPPGRAYVYPIHSRYCFNVVTEPEGVASAALVRAVEPVTGQDLMRQRRGRHGLRELASGPAKLCEAFAIDRKLDGWDLTLGERLWIADDDLAEFADIQVGQSERIGVTSAQHLMLRFFIRESPFVSGPKRLNSSSQGQFG
jgi:DNA-3-methyladenine glycosylase